MAVPKRKTSKAKVRSRSSSHKRKLTTAGSCPECGSPRRPHRVCPSCGTYRGRQVVTITADD
jgi:large subunit ribosomal protein L32